MSQLYSWIRRTQLIWRPANLLNGLKVVSDGSGAGAGAAPGGASSVLVAGCQMAMDSYRGDPQTSQAAAG